MASSLSSVAQLNMDLDSIIAQSRPSNRGRGARRSNGAGNAPFRSSRTSTTTTLRTNRTPPTNRFSSNATVTAANLGSTRIAVSNLDFNVTEGDLWELFGRIGRVSKVQLNYDKNGRSQGTATITFSQHKDAIASVNQFHNVTLDGRAMKLELTVPPNKLDTPILMKKPTPPPRRIVNSAPPPNPRGGLFRSTTRVSGGGVGKRGGAGPRRNGRGRGRGREPRKTISDLDLELDSFMSQRAAVVSNAPISDAMQTD